MKIKNTGINQISILSILITIIVICYSCENKLDSDFRNEPNEVIKERKIQVKNGVLVFNSIQELDEVATALHSSQNGKYIDNINFRSQKNIFDQIILAEDEFVEECLKLPESEIRKISLTEAHSEIYLEMREKGVIKEFEEDGEISYDYALCDPIYASVVNEDGFVAIGDTILYIGEDKVVRCDNMELKNANQLRFTTETDSLAKVYVLHTNIELRSDNERYPQVKYADTFRDGKKYRYSLHLHFDLSSFLLSEGTYKQMNYRYYIAVKSKQQKNLFGGYNYRACKAVLSGNSSSEAKVYQYVSSYFTMRGNTSVVPYETTVSNTIIRLSFWNNINSDQFWTWDSQRSLSFSMGSTKLTIMNLNHSYNYRCIFEGNNAVNMTGTLFVTPPRTVESY